MRHWQTIEGEGGRQLAAIGNGVRRLVGVQEKLGGLANLATAEGQIDDSITERLAKMVGLIFWAQDPLGELDNIVEEYDSTLQADFLRHGLAQVAHTKLTHLQKGVDIKVGKRAYVEITGSGPRIKFHEGSKDEIDRVARIGATYNAPIYAFNSSPKFGGMLVLRKTVFHNPFTISGLVDPSTGEPRVKLELMSRR